MKEGDGNFRSSWPLVRRIVVSHGKQSSTTANVSRGKQSSTTARSDRQPRQAVIVNRGKQSSAAANNGQPRQASRLAHYQEKMRLAIFRVRDQELEAGNNNGSNVLENSIDWVNRPLVRQRYACCTSCDEITLVRRLTSTFMSLLTCWGRH